VIEVGPRAFEQLVADALDLLPDELAGAMENVAVFVEDRHADVPDLLGLYEGTPLTERGDYGGLVMPDRVTIYRLALCEWCETEEEVVEEVAVTVIHEVAHHFGIDDDRLAELGWA
jgi:predicted Zn-dependent protease with MMP-like domain